MTPYDTQADRVPGPAQAPVPRRRYFDLLDGMRGVAALMVILYHVHDYFYPLTALESYLAVDLFFVLSGVVIANSYARRLASGMSLSEFAWLRYVRLYPFYVLCLAIGLVAAALDSASRGSLFWPALFALLLLPNIAGSTMNYAFPLNPPAWSLFFELIANFAYAATVRRLSKRMLCSIMALAALALAFELAHSHERTLDLGWRIHSFPGGLARVGYSFFCGVLLHRIHIEKNRKLIDGVLGNVLSVMILLASAVLLKVDLASDVKPFYDLVVVVGVFPALVYLAMRCEPSPRIARLCVFLGAISYGIYVLHYPVKELLDRIFALSGHGGFLLRHAPWTGVMFIAALVPLCWFIDRVYDAPVRRALLAARHRNKSAQASVDVAGP